MARGITAFIGGLAVCALLAGLCNGARGATIYSGKLSSDPTDPGSDGLVVIGGDDWSLVTIEWTVTLNPGVCWHYEYTIASDDEPAISHAIIGTSLSFMASDVTNWSGTPSAGTLEVQLFEAGGSDNPNMPEDLFGLKWQDFGELSSITFSFDTTRQPVWSDFYIKGGGKNNFGDAWNAGFSDPNPLAVAANGSINDHLLTPDTHMPEPATLALLAIGTGVLAVRRRHRAKQSRGVVAHS